MRWSKRPFGRCRPGAPSFPRFLRKGWDSSLVAVLAALAAAILSISAAAQTQAAPAPPPARFVVVLDAAHGGDDPGGRIGNQPEKTVTLALSVHLRSLLAARGIQVITTRESDVTLDADRRAEIANHAKAQACISLHASTSGFGIHLFTSSLAPAAHAPLPAWRTAQAAWVTRSLALSGELNAALRQADMDVTLGRTSLLAVDSMTCPAVAVEVAPERGGNSPAAAAPDDPSYQARVAEALAAALLEWRSEGAQL